MEKQRFLVWDDAPTLTDGQRRWLVSNENPDNPLRKLVGNTDSINRLRRMAFMALGRRSHRANDLSFALFGPPGVGKTTLAKGYADLLGLPFVELDPKALRSTQDVFAGFERALAKPGYKHGNGEAVDLTLRPHPDDEKSFTIPPCVAMIDECHNLVNAVQQGLLTATEKNTHKMETREGIKVNTEYVCWVLATTDRGLLFDAFDTRFVKINLKPYTQKEMALIVFNQNQDVPMEACQLVAKYAGYITREALAFVTEARINREYRGCSWLEAIEATRVEMGIDEYGMDEKRLTVLKTLGLRGPSSLNGLAQAVGVKEEELTKFILEPLKMYREDRPALISVSHRHFITEAGLKELEKRGYHPDRKRVLKKDAA